MRKKRQTASSIAKAAVQEVKDSAKDILNTPIVEKAKETVKDAAEKAEDTVKTVTKAAKENEEAQPANAIVFNNKYEAAGSLNLTAEKTLTTTETPLAKDQFTFELRDKEGKVLQTKTNDAAGKI